MFLRWESIPDFACYTQSKITNYKSENRILVLKDCSVLKRCLQHLMPSVTAAAWGDLFKSNTLQISMDSSFRQGCVLYELFQLCQSTLAFSRSPRVGV
jgi:hypothetical protein